VLQQVAERLVERRLHAPALFLLESLRPLSFLAGQTLVLLGPLLEPLLAASDYRVFAEAIEDRANLDWLLQRLEEVEESRRDPPAAPAPPDET